MTKPPYITGYCDDCKKKLSAKSLIAIGIYESNGA